MTRSARPRGLSPARWLAPPLLAMLVVLLVPRPALAHPLGNFTANTSARLVVSPDAIAIDYVIDLAEIPTLQARQQMDTGGDNVVSDDELTAYASQRCQSTADGLRLNVGGADLDVGPVGAGIGEFVDGVAGLFTLRIECPLGADWTLDGVSEVRFEDTNALDRIGWREVVALGDGTTLRESDVATESTSERLRNYPTDRLRSPLRITTAALTVAPGGPTLSQEADGAAGEASQGNWFERLTTSYTDLVASRELTLGFGLFATLIAIFLGALHALAPGHGKTVMAAYVVGQRGTMRQALLIGVTVAITHTAGVLGLGLLLSLSETLVPERLFPWFGALSGLLIAGIGAGLLRNVLRARRRAAAITAPAAATVAAHASHGVHEVAGAAALAAEHSHDEGHDHEDDHDHAPATIAHSHGAGATHTHVLPTEGMSRRSLITLGFAGGLVPSPSALLVLLGAIALGRAWFGVVLVAAYGVGLAATLVAGGLLLLRARTFAERWLDRAGSARVGWLSRALPLVTAMAVLLGGLFVAVRSTLLA